jgi:osmoprotectant transport system substrate-binding protein
VRRYGGRLSRPDREEDVVRRRTGRVAIALLLLLLAACAGGGDPDPAAPVTTIRFASYDFTENQTLAEVYAEGVRRQGLPVSVQHGVGTREVVSPALQQGVVDVVVDYLGTAQSFARPSVDVVSRDPDAMYAVLSRTMGGRGVLVLAPSRAQDQNGFAVTTRFAAEHGVSRLSDLAALAPGLTFGGPPECPDRPFCLQGLQHVYGLDFKTVLSMPSRAATVEALQSGQIDVGLLETTDARLAVAPLVLLADDRGLQPPENVVPMVRADAVDRWGEKLQTALEDVSARLTTADLVELNRAVEIDGLTPAEAADQWWSKF